MRIRLAALGIALTGILAFVGFSSLTRDGGVTAVPSSQRSTTASRVAQLEQAANERPDDAGVASQLAALYLQRARESGDPSYYGLAQVAADRALTLAPDDPQALIVAGGVALAKHDFAAGLAIGERARAMHPDVTAIYGVLVDANVELGNYDEALAAAQQLLDRRPDYASYSRVSYLRELHGDLDGAVEAMELAARAAPSPFDEAWARVIIGDLRLRQDDAAAAGREYGRAAAILPGDAMVQAALARLAVARGDLASAETLWRDAVRTRPLPEYAVALGDLLASQGRAAEAEEQYALVRVTQRLFAAAGVDTDIELALFDADHGGDPETVYAAASGAYARRPSIYAADVVAWAAFKAGRLDEAMRYSVESLRLGTRDTRLTRHADAINAAVRARDASLGGGG